LPASADPDVPPTAEPLWPEVRQVVALAVPVAIAELGWMAMSVVDTIMVGGLGPAAIGAIAIGSATFYPFSIFGLGLLLGLDTLVSHAFGAGQREDGRFSLWQGIYLALLETPFLMLLCYLMPSAFPLLGLPADVSRPAAEFLRASSWAVLPLLLYAAFRRYLQAIGHARPVMVVLLTANLVNWGCNWLLIDGHWGFPALFVAGSAYSTVLARIYMAGLLALCIAFFDRGALDLRPISWKRIRQLVALGLPAATQIMLEIGAFGSAALLAGRLSPIALAAHQIAINIASVSYMIPLGISSAAAITVGHAAGQGVQRVARQRGWVALSIGAILSFGSALTFLLIPEQLLSVYTRDPSVLAIGRNLLGVAAAFQLFDALQAVTTGALRGLGNTRFAMLVNLGGYWAFGLPLGALLCFSYGFGVYGLWYGLTLALVLIAAIQLAFWHRLSKRVLSGSA
jgi:multidrug resistance protein, MATE family